MTNYEKIKQMSAEEMAKEKISVDKIEIIVRNTDEKSYYSLKYYDIKDKQEYIGFSSYNLDIVLNYIKNCFVILERENIADNTVGQEWIGKPPRKKIPNKYINEFIDNDIVSKPM